MNVIRLCGGLGNQLFQYAFGKVQESHGIEVKYDIHWYGKKANVGRPYQLNKFKMDVSLAPFVRTTIFEKYVVSGDLKVLKKDGFNFMGYWQNPDYFMGILPQLKKEIQVKESLYTPEYLRLKEEISNCSSLSIHVRRGDYVGHSGWHVLSIKYYLKALTIMRALRGIDKTYVFSDDIEWCRANFKDVTFVNIEDALDFELMKLCKHNITGNSTYSWWAGLLNDNPNKIVIMPTRWRETEQAQGQMAHSFLSPIGWIKI